MVGTALAVLVSREARRAAEDAAQTHAEFVTNAILRYELTPQELETPEPLRGQRYRELLEVVQTRILRLQVPVIRVKIWRPDGVIIFSDDERLVGRRFELEDDVLEAFDGDVVGERSSLDAAENEFERGLAPKLFETYVPLRSSDAT